ncbi:hypothetical protein FPQ18DRAFT_308770 [Pyronema domesticum]|nr:hypothetical protein FPQ18DRAFT_308770 [Pyronema domesticum]
MSSPLLPIWCQSLGSPALLRSCLPRPPQHARSTQHERPFSQKARLPSTRALAMARVLYLDTDKSGRLYDSMRVNGGQTTHEVPGRRRAVEYDIWEIMGYMTLQSTKYRTGETGDHIPHTLIFRQLTLGSLGSLAICAAPDDM